MRLVVPLGESAGGRLIDACVHHRWHPYAELLDYLPRAWRSYVGTPGSLPGGAGARAIFPLFAYPNPAGDSLAAAEPAADGEVSSNGGIYAVRGAPAGASYDLLNDQVLEPGGVERALLTHGLEARLAPATPNPYLAVAIVSAINDWTVDRWLSRDDRLHAAVLIPTQSPTEAAAEIRRIGPHPRMAAIVVGSLGMGKLLGHPVNHPIFEAAQELELPIIVHRGLDGVPDTPTGPAGGPPMTFADYWTIAPLAVISQVFNLISNGVFAKYPRLRVHIEGAGLTWIRGLVQRMEMSWTALRREVPWVRESPADYFYRHIRVGTLGIERAGGRDILVRMTETAPELADLVCYGSGYPDWDTVRPDDVLSAFPKTWHARLMFDNADRWFRWSTAAAPAVAAPQSPGGEHCV